MKPKLLGLALFAALTVLGFAASAGAVDGVIQINQAKVLANGGFPYVITQPGSYRLTGNLSVTGASDAIDVNANNVTIDLNGFSITGPSSSGSGIIGGSATGTTVENGTVTGFHFGVATGDNGIVRNVHADSNGLAGPNLGIGIGTGNNALIEGCTANNNGGDGITTGENSRVSGSTTNSNGVFGIQTGNNSVIEGCTASSNSTRLPQNSGGISAGNNSVIEGCTLNSNVAGVAIQINGSADLILRNTISGNPNGGITVPDSTTGIGENVFNGNGSGLSADFNGGTSMKNNVCSGTLC
jgi:hypothetical protein